MATKTGKLPKKEADLFRNLINHYEHKHYQKGIKVADTILKKFPTHGETQAMKGLIMNCLENKKEAYDLVKEGLKNEVRSSICWHVYGLLHRSDNNYAEAMKCYMNAQRIDSTNQNILRDLATLQIQTGDFPGFLESRRKIMLSNPTLRLSWVAFAVALFLNGHYQQSFDKITEYFERDMVRDRGDAYEEGELFLFQCCCLENMRSYSDAVAHLQKFKHKITDKFFVEIKIAELLLLQGKFTEATAAWHNLLVKQPDNYRFHTGLQAAVLQLQQNTAKQMLALKRLEMPSTVLQLNSEQRQRLKDAYSQGGYSTRNLQKILLTFCNLSSSSGSSSSSGNCSGAATAEEQTELRNLLDDYMRSHLRKAIPSLCHDISSLIRIPSTATSSTIADTTADTTTAVAAVSCSSSIEYATDAADVRNHPVLLLCLPLIDGYIENLKATGKFSATTTTATTGDATSTTTATAAAAVEEREPPSALLWAMYLKAHLLEMCGDLEAALLLLEECIEHTPTALDMQLKKARLLRKSGDISTAAVVMDDARALDLQDRYLNNKATKYFLLADEVELAQMTIAMFTKHDGDPMKSLYDLQCSWYELEAADSYARCKQWGAALRKYYAVRKHFQDFVLDAFDFHSYCCRKTTLRAYLDNLATNAKLPAHQFLQRAARGSLRIFLHLLESPEDVDGLGHLPPAERKKERAKLKKAKKKAEEDAKKEDEDGLLLVVPQEKKAAASDEPVEEELLQRDFAVEATFWCELLQPQLSHCEGATVALVAELLMKKADYELAINTLRTGLAANPQNSELLLTLARLANKIKNPSKKQGAIPNSQIVKARLAKLLEADYSSEQSTAAADDQVPELNPSAATTATADNKPINLNINALVGRVLSIASSEKATLLQRLNAVKAMCALEKSTTADAIKTAAVMLLGAESGAWRGRGVEVEVALATCKFLEAQFPGEDFTAAFAAESKLRFPRAAAFRSQPLQSVAAIRAEASDSDAKTAATMDVLSGVTNNNNNNSNDSSSNNDNSTATTAV